MTLTQNIQEMMKKIKDPQIKQILEEQLCIWNTRDAHISPAIVIQDFKLIYVPIAKCASSSIKLALRRYFRMPDPEPTWTIHNTPWRRLCHTCLDIVDLMYDEDGAYRTFTVIRNPWDRLYSCYKSKILSTDTTKLKDLVGIPGLRSFMPFSEFIDRIEDIGSDIQKNNEHIRPQRSILNYWLGTANNHVPPPCPDYNIHACKAEELNEGWKELMDRFPGMPPLPHVNQSHDLSYKKAYSIADAFRVGKIYDIDCQHYHYDF